MFKFTSFMLVAATTAAVFAPTQGAEAAVFTDLRYTFSDGTTGGPLGGPADLTASNISFTDPANMAVSNSSNNVFIRGDVTDGDATVADPGAALGVSFVPTDYLSWTIDIDAGSQLELDTVRFDYFNELTDGGNYSASFALRSSVDGFASDLVAAELIDSNTPTTATADLSLLGTDYIGLTGSVEFRLFTYGDNRFNGSNERSRIDNIYHSGETTAVIPEPGSMALLALGGLMAYRRR